MEITEKFETEDIGALELTLKDDDNLIWSFTVNLHRARAVSYEMT